MNRTFPLLACSILLLGLLACQSGDEIADSDSTPRVVFRGSSGQFVPPPGLAASEGRALGPGQGAPEVVVLGDPAPDRRTRPRTVRRPDPAPRVIHETIYIEREAPAPSAEPVRSEPAVTEPAVESETDPTPEPAVASGDRPGDGPARTGRRDPVPDRSPDRVQDAIVGAAIGAGIGAVLGGGDGAIRGGIGGAAGGAIGGRSGAILGSVLGAGGRGRAGGCWAPRSGGRFSVAIR